MRMRPAHAYTLVEVLMVVTIIALASAIVVPRMLDASSFGVQAGARTLIADLLYAQNEAIAHQEVRKVVIDTTADRYWLEDGDGDKVQLAWRTSGGDEQNLIDYRRDERFDGVTLAKANASGTSYTLEPDGGTITITFDELGAPDQGAAIGLSAKTGDYVVTIASFTGKVTVKQIR